MPGAAVKHQWLTSTDWSVTLPTMTPIHLIPPRVALRGWVDAQFYRIADSQSLVLIEISDHLSYVLPEADVASSVFRLDYGDWENVQTTLATSWSLNKDATAANLKSAVDTELQKYGFRAPDGDDLT